MSLSFALIAPVNSKFNCWIDEAWRSDNANKRMIDITFNPTFYSFYCYLFKAKFSIKRDRRIYSISQFFEILHHNERTAVVMLPHSLHPVLGLAVLHHHVQWGGQQLPGCEASETSPGQPREQLPAGLRLQRHHRRLLGHVAFLGKHHGHDDRCFNIRREIFDHRVKSVEFIFYGMSILLGSMLSTLHPHQ